MLVLGIETTCDETAASLVACDQNGSPNILTNIVHSQITEHSAFGGVVPEIAARAHVDAIDYVTANAINEAQCDLKSVDAVAVASGPGLIGGLLVGVVFAKTLAQVMRKPCYAINHLEAHALSVRLTHSVEFPYLLLLASGGHTQLVLVMGVGAYILLGTTVDDAIGETYDKIAKYLGLPYPGGPAVEQRALNGDGHRFALPRPMLGRRHANFSLSGLKTAIRVEGMRISPLTDQDVNDLCASYQVALWETIEDRIRQAMFKAEKVNQRPKALVIAGGVAANAYLKTQLTSLAKALNIAFYAPPHALCGDNAAMIAWTAIERIHSKIPPDLAANAQPNWPFCESVDAICN